LISNKRLNQRRTYFVSERTTASFRRRLRLALQLWWQLYALWRALVKVNVNLVISHYLLLYTHFAFNIHKIPHTRTNIFLNGVMKIYKY